jgi:hypothetical protein
MSAEGGSVTAPSADLELPDSALVREARGIADAALDAMLVAHSCRAFLLGRAYGRARGIDFDEEGLCLAALFHDLGLAPGRRDPRTPFTVAGSRALEAFLRDRGDAGRATPLVEAIDFHMQLLPRWSKGNVAGLLQIGAWMDVTRLRRWAVPAQAEAIEARWPREGFGQLAFMRRLLGTFTSLSACAGLVAPR